ncbi:hypothetical protein BaRGS_00003834 [Batillaria attramentaria]|uniref:Uncharacterized protein n=1 Tax=Batillaria attramentaria TaxID=370345 RepID=A0ABD0LZB7_9CAEN
MSPSHTACSLMNPICIQNVHLPFPSSDILPHACARVSAVCDTGVFCQTPAMPSYGAAHQTTRMTATARAVCCLTERHPGSPEKPAFRRSQRLIERLLVTRYQKKMYYILRQW